MSNLLGVLSQRSARHIQLASPSLGLTRAMALPSSVGLLRTVVARSAARILAAQSNAIRWSPPARDVVYEHSPLLSPLLHRVCRFHLETLDESVAVWSAALPAISDATLVGRSSARSFTSSGISRGMYEAVKGFLLNRRSLLPRAAKSLRCYLVRVCVEGEKPGAECIEADGTSTAVDLEIGTATELSSRMHAICEQQMVVREAAMVLIIGVRWDLLRATAPAYREVLSEVGHMGAELGAQAVQLGIGTTMIGGFSDDGARRVMRDPSWQPIAVQLYGQPARHGHKADAATRVFESRLSER